MQNTAAIKSFSPFQIFPSFWPVSSRSIKRPMLNRQTAAKIFDFFKKDLFISVASCGCPPVESVRGAIQRNLNRRRSVGQLRQRLQVGGRPLRGASCQSANRVRNILPAVNISLTENHHALAVFIRALFETIRGAFVFHADKCAGATKRNSSNYDQNCEFVHIGT